jgi:hypothetical protein
MAVVWGDDRSKGVNVFGIPVFARVARVACALPSLHTVAWKHSDNVSIYNAVPGRRTPALRRAGGNASTETLSRLLERVTYQNSKNGFCV